MGVPYLPTRTLLGSDLARAQSAACTRPSPACCTSQAIEPDVAILHVQRADVEGHAHCWGNLGVVQRGRAWPRGG